MNYQEENMNEKPTENKERHQADNTPIGLDAAENTSSGTPQKKSGAGFPIAFGITGLVCIGVLGLIWITLYLDYPVRTTTPTPDWSTTRNAWVKPDESPTFGSKEDANNAIMTGGEWLSLEFLATNSPVLPDVIQPGEVFIYNILLEKSEPRLWTYGWCAISQNILEANFSQMKIEFIANESPVPANLLQIQDEVNDDGSACRSYNVLILDWPQGIHHLNKNRKVIR